MIRINGQEYWIWLQLALYAGAKLAPILREYGNSPSALYEDCRSGRIRGETLTKKQADALLATPLEEAREVLGVCRSKRWSILTPDNPAYPKRLRQLVDFPAALYVCGTLPTVDEEVLVSIVGTRNASDYGTEVAFRLSAALARAGAIVVSGGALGIDSAAHRGALQSGGKTITFLGCGLGYSYLPENRDLRRAISQSGAVVSEYPPYYPASRITFPTRNRLISGIGVGTVVIEAGVKSGSLITADLAASQGKDVFAVPGSVISTNYRGVNRLLQYGAKPVFCALDVLEEYAAAYPHKLDLTGAETLIGDGIPQPEKNSGDIHHISLKKNQNNKTDRVPGSDMPEKPQERMPSDINNPGNNRLPDGISENAVNIYKLIGYDPLHVDDLIRVSVLSPREILRAVTELELGGFIESLHGRRYKRT